MVLSEVLTQELLPQPNAKVATALKDSLPPNE